MREDAPEEPATAGTVVVPVTLTVEQVVKLTGEDEEGGDGGDDHRGFVAALVHDGVPE